jgi:hypothetical protein
LLAIAIFCNEVKGKSMLALSRDLGTHYMTAFVLAHKMREAMASEVRQTTVGGEGKRAEIDGGYFGGYVKPANRRENRRDRRLRQHRTGKRRVVVVIRERNGRTLPGVFHSEVEALAFIRRQGAAWNRAVCRRGQRVERAARPLHAAPDQPRRSLQPRRRVRYQYEFS